MSEETPKRIRSKFVQGNVLHDIEYEPRGSRIDLKLISCPILEGTEDDYTGGESLGVQAVMQIWRVKEVLAYGQTGDGWNTGLYSLWGYTTYERKSRFDRKLNSDSRGYVVIKDRKIESRIEERDFEISAKSDSIRGLVKKLHKAERSEITGAFANFLNKYRKNAGGFEYFDFSWFEDDMPSNLITKLTHEGKEFEVEEELSHTAVVRDIIANSSLYRVKGGVKGEFFAAVESKIVGDVWNFSVIALDEDRKKVEASFPGFTIE